MAAACGIMVGNIYIGQPLLDELARYFGVPEHQAGLVAIAAQVGYALGILFLVPIADIAEPRRLMRVLMGVTGLGLLAAAAAPNIAALAVATGILSATTVVPQILIPLAASQAPAGRRGRVIGTLQTGLILGILLSRTVSGAVTDLTGTWRASFLLGSALTLGVLLVLPSFIAAPQREPQPHGYAGLLRSLPPLLLHAPLRLSAALGFCVFGAFSAFWATLAFHLATPAFGLGPAATGLFGLWGAPGAVLAPLAGRLADRVGASAVNLGALACAVAAFALAGVLGGSSLIALVVAVNLLDFGVQSGQVANQTRIFALGSSNRARLNTVYMVSTFGGGALGSVAGTLAWSIAGWPGVCAVAACSVLAGAGLLLASLRRGQH